MGALRGLLGAACPADGRVGVKLGLPVSRMLTTPRPFLPPWVGSSVSSQARPSLRFSRELRVSCCLAVPHPQPLLGMLGRVLCLLSRPCSLGRRVGGGLASGTRSQGHETSPCSSGPHPALWGARRLRGWGGGPVSGLRSAPGQSWEAAPVGGPGLAPPDPAASPGWPPAAPPLHQDPARGCCARPPLPLLRLGWRACVSRA